MNWFRVIVPSKGRSDQMARLLSLVPEAVVSVDEREEADYRPHVPDGQLILHPPMTRLGAIRHWCCMWAKDRGDEAMVMLDDDLRFVHSFCWPKIRRVTDPAVIARLMSNQCRILLDLDLAVGCWATDGTTALHYTNCEPFKLNRLISSAIALNLGRYGPEGSVCYDERRTSADDTDLALQCLLRDRVVIRDTRWFWDFGMMRGNAGGLQTARSSPSLVSERQGMGRKWGKYANALRVTRR